MHTHQGPPPRFLGGFYCRFDTITEGAISMQKGWSILYINVRQNFFTIKFSDATREMTSRGTIGGIDEFSKL